MAEFSENRHISNLINMSCKVIQGEDDIAYCGWQNVISALLVEGLRFCLHFWNHSLLYIFINFNKSFI